MVRSLELDEALVQEALSLGEESNLDCLVNVALQEYVRHRRQLQVIELFGTIDYDEDFDRKAQRQVP